MLEKLAFVISENRKFYFESKNKKQINIFSIKKKMSDRIFFLKKNIKIKSFIYFNARIKPNNPL